jgi:enoyl-[acyl-carrier protein] reductase I
MGLLVGKKALVTGVASDRSIATGIARALRREGADVTLTYQGERLKGRVQEIAASLGAGEVLPLDVSDDGQIEQLRLEVEKRFGTLDILVHSIAFAPKQQLSGRYLDAVTRDGFRVAHDISAFSFAALAKALKPLMAGRSGSMLTLTYVGSQRAMPMYNVMGPAKASLEANVRYMAMDLGIDGIRVNAISAGPIKTPSSAAIAGFDHVQKTTGSAAALKRSVSVDEIGNAAVFLCSEWASGITGEVLYVDAGYRIAGLAAEEPVAA